jgi:phenylpropionate dioxygenase-like ring-hydroxylating dioxygenase large terminal subunit
MLTDVEIARIRAPLNESWTLPPSAYIDPAVWERERETIFARDWICVARVEQLPEPGDYLCTDLPGQPIVITRGRDGKLRALSRICIHRAMPVVSGQGNATRFVCPYHNWTYELDGRLRSAPMMDGVADFEPDRCSLPELGLEIWNGFVFVNLDPSAEPLSPRLAGLAQLIERYDYGDLVIAATTEFDSPWNWKILVENFMEAYHHIGPHRTTFEPFFPARESTVPDNGGAPWTFLRMPAKPVSEDAASAAAAVADDPGIFPRLTEAERHQLLAMNVYPTLLFAASDSGGVWYQAEPTAHDAMHLHIHYLLPREIAATLDDAAREAIIEQVRVIHREDIAVNEGPWRGFHAALTSQGRLSTFEAAIWQLNQLWLDRVLSAS